MSAARKPVIVRKLSRDWCAGYAVQNLDANDEEMELLDTSGKLTRILWSQVKWVCYVREFGGAEGSGFSGPDSTQPERLLRRRFSGRPRIAGLWLRMILADGEDLEGIAANDRSLIESAGLLLTPPDTRSNTQRIFVPRSSIRELHVLAVIAPVSRPRPGTGLQPELFERYAIESQAPEEPILNQKPPIPFPIQSHS